MNKREAKRIACYRAAIQIQGDVYADGIDMIEGMTDRDAEKIREALQELVDELKQRAGDIPMKYQGAREESK